jgi:23S rRNA (pseudouridine1915-N3)-methyltransferase
MKIKWITVGKTDDACVRELTEKYLKRVKRYYPIEYIEIPDLKNTKNLSPGQRKTKEGELIKKHLKPGDYVILLDEKGKSYTSLQWAKHLENLMHRTTTAICFVTGGAYGFPDEIYRMSNEKLSLSPMTFSHQIIRCIFAEQLYRAVSIMKGLPYHNE